MDQKPPTPDYYALLGVKPSASPDELRRAAQLRLKELKLAYLTLADPTRRQQHDNALDQARVARMKAQLAEREARVQAAATPPVADGSAPGWMGELRRWWRRWRRRPGARRDRAGRHPAFYRR